MFLLNLQPLLDFSHTYCVAICAVLVPLNVFTTSAMLILTGMGNPLSRGLAGVAVVPALLMFLHIGTWLAIGVVMPPTYILATLGTTCLAVNLWGILHPRPLQHLLRHGWSIAQRLVLSAQAATR